MIGQPEGTLVFVYEVRRPVAFSLDLVRRQRVHDLATAQPDPTRSLSVGRVEDSPRDPALSVGARRDDVDAAAVVPVRTLPEDGRLVVVKLACTYQIVLPVELAPQREQRIQRALVQFFQLFLTLRAVVFVRFGPAVLVLERDAP
jgi:hypothetical protein